MFVRQAMAMIGLAVRTIPARLVSACVVIFGVALVVAVFVAVLALGTSFERAARSTGKPSRAIVLQPGATSEAGSELSRDTVNRILDAPQVLKDAKGVALGSGDSLAFPAMSNLRTGLDAFVTVRGAGRQFLQVHPEIRIIAGRSFVPGKQEVIVGRAVQKQIRGLAVGSSIVLPHGAWSIVGAFESGGDSHESEVITDAETLMSAYRKPAFNSITVRLADAASMDPFKEGLAQDPTLAVYAIREDTYFVQAFSRVATLMRAVALGIGAIMAFGAACGALNIMYSWVSARSREIGTLRAVGFGAASVVASIMVESLLLACVGAVLGVAAVWLVLNGKSVSTLTGIGPAQMTFDMSVSGFVVVAGIALALGIGALGGLLPAVRAGRMQVVDALRNV